MRALLLVGFGLVILGVLFLFSSQWQPVKTGKDSSFREPSVQLRQNYVQPLETTGPQDLQTAPLPPPEALATPPSYPSHHPDNSPLRDPEVRRELLRSIAEQQRALYQGLHRPWLDSLGLSADQTSLLVSVLLKHDLMVQDYIIPYHAGRPAGVMPEQKQVAEMRAQLLEKIGNEFGSEIAESYRLQFPGPMPSP